MSWEGLGTGGKGHGGGVYGAVFTLTQRCFKSNLYSLVATRPDMRQLSARNQMLASSQHDTCCHLSQMLC